MEKEFIKKVRYCKCNQIFTIEQGVLYWGVKIDRVTPDPLYRMDRIKEVLRSGKRID
jgi:hypothetical protein